jgi:parallel beta-helix repeat protein
MGIAVFCWGGMPMRILTLIAIATVCGFGNADATNYYLSPGGSDSNAGGYSAPWATLQHAQGILVAGDTLFVMGGAYTTAQSITAPKSGTALHPIVIKAYGNSVADFQNSPDGRPRFIDTTSRISHLVLDGESHIDPSSTTRFLKFTGECDNMAVIMSSCGFVMRGTEWNGTNSSLGANQCWMFQMASADSFLIENNYMHDGGHAECSNPPDCTTSWQESGDCLYMWGCSYGKIRNNIFMRGNHDLVMIQSLRWPPYTSSRYILIQNNIFDNGWGGCLYLTMGTSYCLVEGNTILNPGKTTTYSKPGDHNTIRKNAFYCPSDLAIIVQSAHDIVPGAPTADYNYIYNNTFFSSGMTHLEFFARQEGTYYSNTSTEHELVANNIFYKVAGKDWYGTNSKAAIVPFMCQAPLEHNWVTPDVNGTYPSSTNWGDSRFLNNLIRNDSRGVQRDSLIMFCGSDALGTGYTQDGSIPHQGIGRIPRMQNIAIDPSGRWSGNIGGDPKLASESPDTYGAGWWYLQAGSAAIDSGIAVVDSNGIWMRANAAGYSWSDLSFIGSAPDIGAHEFNGENPSPLSTPPLSSFPTKKP